MLSKVNNNLLAALLVIVVILVGCQDSNSKKGDEGADAQKKKAESMQVFTSLEGTSGVEMASPQASSSTGSFSPGETVAFEGILNIHSLEDTGSPHHASVSIYTYDTDKGIRIITNSSVKELQKIEGDRYKYHVELKVPKKEGTYDLVVSYDKKNVIFTQFDVK